MLLSYGARNFLCFKEGFEISFEQSAGKIANIMCLKGANSSGKTNAIKPLAFLRDFCCNSWNRKPEDELIIYSFFKNDKPSEFYCEFLYNETKYLYELTVNNNEVFSEIIHRKKKKYIEIFSRERDVVKATKEFKELEKIKLRKNASIISTAHQYEFKKINPIYDFFDKIITNVNWEGRFIFPLELGEISKFYNDDKKLLEFTKNIIKLCDPGLKDIKISHKVDEKGSKKYYPIFIHYTDQQNNILSFYEQSSGTKSLYMQLPLYFTTIEEGMLLVLDEFDINFHPDILPKLLDLFENNNINTNNAQIIFSTHNTDILDKMGKYRTVLLDKSDSESFAYRLDEIPGDVIRNDRSLANIYKSGKIGGVPKI